MNTRNFVYLRLFSRVKAFSTRLHVRQVKTAHERCLIRVFSGHSLGRQDPQYLCVDREYSDQPAQIPGSSESISFLWFRVQYNDLQNNYLYIWKTISFF